MAYNAVGGFPPQQLSFTRKNKKDISIPNNTTYNNTSSKGNARVGHSVASNHEFYKFVPALFAKDGVNIVVYSGYRPGDMTKSGNRSRHSIEGGPWI